MIDDFYEFKILFGERSIKKRSKIKNFIFINIDHLKILNYMFLRSFFYYIELSLSFKYGILNSGEFSSVKIHALFVINIKALFSGYYDKTI